MVTTGFLKRSTNDLPSQLMVKERNLKRLFDLIFTEKEISRASLATITKLSPTTVSTLIDDMIASGLIVTSGVEKSNKIGRRAILLKVNPDRLQIPTIAWERDGFRYVLYDLACNELERFYFPTTNHANYVETLHNLIMEKSQGLDSDKLGALCITIPAIVDVKGGKIISTVLDVQTQKEFLVDVRKIFAARPVVIGNESAFYAYAEREFVLNRKVQNLVYINVNIGVGAGIIYRGKIYRGSFGMAGEFGHTSVDMYGPLCTCGNRGCLERLISTPRIVERAVAAVKDTSKSTLFNICEGDLSQATLHQVAQAFLSDEQEIIDAMREVATIIGFGINNVLRIFDPEILVIGGGIEIFGKSFLDMVKEVIACYGSSIIASGVKIIYTELPPICKNRGAAKYYINNIMRITEQKEEDVIIC
ncbi:MAG: ROK family protein [Sphaerochaetaceae bacterium]|nr:ROK family protein [Sphaerochaetaceae bacterium]